MGKQFADDSMTPSPISVTRNQYKDEIPEMDPQHEGATPGHTNPLYKGGHYSDEWDGGYKNYGVSVTDLGQSPSKTVTKVDGDQAKRGRES